MEKILYFVLGVVTLGAFAIVFWFAWRRMTVFARPALEHLATRLSRVEELNPERQREVGELLGGRFRRGYLLGRGMNAAAYGVEDSKRGEFRPLVSKVLLTPEEDPRITQASFKRHLERFRREIRNLEKLQRSEFVVRIRGSYPNAVPPFFVMELCEGSLEERLVNAPLDMQTVLNVMADVCRGLAECHGQGIFHRDLKPANILSREGHWVLADFGMSLLSGQDSFVSVGESLPGTIPYTAPEVMYYDPDRIDPRADVFSLGMTLKAIFTGDTVWEGPTSRRLRMSVDEGRRKEIGLFDDLLKRTTSLEPGGRPSCVIDTARELENLFREVNRMRTALPERERTERPVLDGVQRLEFRRD